MESNMKGAVTTAPPSHPRAVPPKKKVDRFGGTSLARRAEKGNLAGVEDAYSIDPSELDQPDNAGVVPLQKAACHGHLAVVKFLLDKKCRINCCDQEGDTPLIDAVANGHLAVVKVLLRAGLNPHHANRYGRRAIDHLPAKDDQACEPVDNQIRDLISEAMQAWGESNANAEQEPEPSVPMEAKPLTRHDLLHIERTIPNLRKFAGQGDPVAVNHILSLVTPDVSCAVAAARGGHTDILSFILATMNPGDKDPDPLKYPDTPLLAAIGRGHLDVLELILNQDDFNPTRRTRDGKTYWQVAEDQRGPKWPIEVQLLKKRFDDYEESKSGAGMSKKRTAASESSDEATRPSKLPRTVPDRTGSSTSSKVRSATSRRPSGSVPVSEKISSSETDKTHLRSSKTSKPIPSQKDVRPRRRSNSSSSPLPVREPQIRRRRVVNDDEDDDDDDSLSDRPVSTAVGKEKAKPVSSQTSFSSSNPATSKPAKVVGKPHKPTSNESKKLIRAAKQDGSSIPGKPVKRERVNSVGQSGRPSVIAAGSSDSHDPDRRAVPSTSDHEKGDSLHRSRTIPPPHDLKADAVSSSPSSVPRDRADRPRARSNLGTVISTEEKERMTQEIRDRIEREERSRIAKEEREKAIREEGARIVKAEREALERQRLEMEEAKERERLRTEQEEFEKSEQSRLQLEGAEAARREREEEAIRQREAFIDLLPPALTNAIRIGPDRPIRATGLKMGIVEQFLPIWTVPYRDISPDPSPSRQNERWMMSFQVVGLLGLGGLDLADDDVGLSHWERIPVTETQMSEWMRYYTGHQLCDLEVTWPETDERRPAVDGASLEDCRNRLSVLWSRLYWVRLVDFLAEAERRPDLKGLCIGQVDDNAFVSPDGTGYGGRYVEGHAGFGSSSRSALSSIRDLIFHSHGLACPDHDATG